jgi:hypothetical protein
MGSSRELSEALLLALFFILFLTNWFSLQNRCHVSFSFKLPLFGLGSWSKGFGTILKGLNFVKVYQNLVTMFFFGFLKKKLSCKNTFMNDYDKILMI